MKQEITDIAERFEKPPEYFRSDRQEVLALVPSTARRILDVGCGAGVPWRAFPGEVYGIESDETAAREARAVLADVVVGNVEHLKLAYDDGFFDCVVCADILEHLYDPWGLLQRVRPLLAPEGVLVASVPNIRFYRILRALLFKGEFRYTRFGILDIDHVRFFTRHSMEGMLTDCGYDVTRLERVMQRSLKYRVLNALVCGGLSELLTKQYLVVGSPRRISNNKCRMSNE